MILSYQDWLEFIKAIAPDLTVLQQAGLNSFVMTPKKWIESAHAIGITSKSGRYGGTFAHKDIVGEQ